VDRVSQLHLRRNNAVAQHIWQCSTAGARFSSTAGCGRQVSDEVDFTLAALGGKRPTRRDLSGCRLREASLGRPICARPCCAAPTSVATDHRTRLTTPTCVARPWTLAVDTASRPVCASTFHKPWRLRWRTGFAWTPDSSPHSSSLEPDPPPDDGTVDDHNTRASPCRTAMRSWCGSVLVLWVGRTWYQPVRVIVDASAKPTGGSGHDN